MAKARPYDSQRQLRRAGAVDAGKARVECARPGCGRWYPKRRIRLGYCPECWSVST